MPHIRASAIRNGGAPPGEDEDVASEAVARFLAEIENPSHFEVRFNSAAQTIARRAGAHIRRGKRGQRDRDAMHGLPGITYPEPLATTDEFERADARMLIEEHLPALPAEHAQALVLRFYQGLPVSSRYPDRVTVASTLGCSRRKAQQLLAEGLAILESRMKRGADE